MKKIEYWWWTKKKSIEDNWRLPKISSSHQTLNTVATAALASTQITRCIRRSLIGRNVHNSLLMKLCVCLNILHETTRQLKKAVSNSKATDQNNKQEDIIDSVSLPKPPPTNFITIFMYLSHRTIVQVHQVLTIVKMTEYKSNIYSYSVQCVLHQHHHFENDHRLDLRHQPTNNQQTVKMFFSWVRLDFVFSNWSK